MASARRSFAARRRAVGHTQESFAEAVGVGRRTVSAWESGDTEPQPGIRPRLAAALRVTRDELDDLLNDFSPGLRRDRPGDRLDSAMRQPSTTDLVSVAQLRQQIAALERDYDSKPSLSLIADAGQCLGQLRFLRAHAASGRVRRELQRVEVEASILMSKLTWDASGRRDPVTPASYLDLALGVSNQLGDKVSQGHVLLRKGYIDLYSARNGHGGRDLANQAASVARRSSNALTGLALLHAAEGSAMLGEAPGCEQALSQAERYLDRIVDDDPAFDLYSPTQWGRLAGSCYLRLNRPARAQQILESTEQELVAQRKSRAIVLGNLTLALLRQNLLDEAIGRIHEAIDLIELTWAGGGLTVVFGACRELSPWRAEPAVQDVQDRLNNVMAMVATP